MHKKLKKAIAIIQKFGKVNAKPTNEETICYLYEQTQKSIGSAYVAKATAKAMKQMDFPKDVAYDSGMLVVIIQPSDNPVIDNEVVEVAETIEVIEQEEPKRKRKTEKTDESDTLS